MSERMIEIQRAKMGLPPMTAAGTSVGNTTPSSSQGAGAAGVMNSRTPVNAVAVRQSPQQAAAASLFAEDEELQLFLQKIQRRDDNMTSDQGGGPTVPTALSRRVLQRQSVGYLDETVSAVASASADRFLATVLQQAVACRDQRLMGAELEREQARKRRRHVQQYKADSDHRQRRKLALEEARRKSNLAAIEAAKNLGKAGSAASTSPTKSKKKKKKAETTVTENGNKNPDPTKQNENDDESSEDSMDEEEEYYEEFFGDDGVEAGEDEIPNEDDEDDTRYNLLLRDLVRPLEAWGVRLTGKLGLGAAPVASREDAESDDAEIEEEAISEPEKNGHSDAGENVPSPSASKAPKASQAGKKDKKTTEPSDGASSSNRASSQASSIKPSSPVPKPS